MSKFIKQTSVAAVLVCLFGVSSVDAGVFSWRRDRCECEQCVHEREQKRHRCCFCPPAPPSGPVGISIAGVPQFEPQEAPQDAQQEPPESPQSASCNGSAAAGSDAKLKELEQKIDRLILVVDAMHNKILETDKEQQKIRNTLKDDYPSLFQE